MYTDRGAPSLAGGSELQPSADTTYYVVVREMPDLASGTDGTGTYGILVSDTTPAAENDRQHPKRTHNTHLARHPV